MTAYPTHIYTPASYENRIAHGIQINEDIELSDASRHVIWDALQDITADYRATIKQYQLEDHALRWEELRRFLVHNRHADTALIEEIMERLDGGECVRGKWDETV